jgi:hypothetical protein
MMPGGWCRCCERNDGRAIIAVDGAYCLVSLESWWYFLQREKERVELMLSERHQRVEFESNMSVIRG